MNSAPAGNTLLRPEFTRTLAARLSAGASLMLTSPHGQGRRRTLRDLRLCLPASTQVLQANLRDCPASSARLLETLANQAGISGVKSLDTLLEQLPPQSLIILHNFDELLPGEASGFDAAFFATLNSMSEREGLALLCVSESMRSDLPLTIDPLLLPPLTRNEMADELSRRGITDSESVIEAITGSAAPYSSIEAIAPENRA